MAHLSQRLGFDLPDALAGDPKLSAYFLERSAVTVDETEPLFENLPFTLGQGIQDVSDFFPEARRSQSCRSDFRHPYLR